LHLLTFTIPSLGEIAETFSQHFQLLPAQPFLQADETLVANDEVVNQFNIKVLTRGDQLLRYGNVLWRGGGIAAGVIMADQNGWTVAYDGGSIDIC
jgi:hypothetical protein